MIDLTSADAIEKLADLVAERVAAKLKSESSRVLVSRDELAAITGLGVRSIDRMAKGGSFEKDRTTNKAVWRESAVKLDPIRSGGRVLFDKTTALAAIKAGSAG
ncbi:MAG: hypothetical protein IT422_03000 [Pirellulaceae bacterium]|nr:hypothetical protein [Pirellulaceae bacterium]